MTTPGPAGSPSPYPSPGGWTPADPVPGSPPPPGPGVVPPFPAPPTEGKSIRMWLGLGVAGLAVLVCCGGGFAAVVALLFTETKAIEEQAQVAVGDYLDNLSDGRYEQAYKAQCAERVRAESASDFAARERAEPRVTAYEFDEVELAASEIVQPVDVTYENGDQRNVRFRLVQSRETGGLEVCGEAG